MAGVPISKLTASPDNVVDAVDSIPAYRPNVGTIKIPGTAFINNVSNATQDGIKLVNDPVYNTSVGTTTTVKTLIGTGGTVLESTGESILINSPFVGQATEFVRGTAQLASMAEVNAGTDDNKIVTPYKLAQKTVAKAGDTMIGALTLPSDPTSNLHAATKQYVDARTTSLSSTSDSKFLPLNGGTMTGKINLDGNPTANLHAATKQYVDSNDALGVLKAGDTMTGALTLPTDPTANLHAATKQYVDAADATRLPLAGGTMTGKITLDSNPVSDFHAATKRYVDNNDALRVVKSGDTMTGALTLPFDPTANLHAATKQYVDALVPGTAKAWVNFSTDSSQVVTINSSYNITGVAAGSGGRYVVTVPFVITNRPVFITAGMNISGGYPTYGSITSRTTNSVTLRCDTGVGGGGNYNDISEINVIFY